MQVWKTQVQICKGGKRKYGKGKSDLNADVTVKYHCQMPVYGIGIGRYYTQQCVVQQQGGHIEHLM